MFTLPAGMGILAVTSDAAPVVITPGVPTDSEFGNVQLLTPLRSIQTNGGNNTFDFVYGSH